jgi:hypothetical protein
MECDILTLMTYLNRSLQWMCGRICYDEDFIHIVYFIEVFVATGDQEIIASAEQISMCTQRHSCKPGTLCGLISPS